MSAQLSPYPVPHVDMPIKISGLDVALSTSVCGAFLNPCVVSAAWHLELEPLVYQPDREHPTLEQVRLWGTALWIIMHLNVHFFTRTH